MNLIYDKFLERCGGPSFTSVDIEAVQKHHQNIFDAAKRYSYVQDMKIMTQISGLLTLIMEQCWKNIHECEVSISEKKWIPVKRYIEENYTFNICLDELSSIFSINKYYLVRKFREVYGLTINQYVTKLRITFVTKELLRFSDFNMTKISMKTGFNDSAYFTRVFNKEVGVSPSEFRKQWQGKTQEYFCQGQCNPNNRQDSQ